MSDKSNILFYAGSNMPGYMPDEPAEGFESFDDAKRYLIAQMRHDADSWADFGLPNEGEEAAEELTGLMEDLNLCTQPQTCGFTARLSNRHYFIHHG